MVDSVCNTCDYALIKILLRNDNSNPVRFHLSTGQLATADTHKSIWSLSKIMSTDPRETNGDLLSKLQPGQFVTDTVNICGIKNEWDGCSLEYTFAPTEMVGISGATNAKLATTEIEY